MRKAMILILIASALSAGCTPSVVTSNAAGGVIQHNLGTRYSTGYKRASAECARFGKQMVPVQNDVLTNTFSYRCVVTESGK